MHQHRPLLINTLSLAFLASLLSLSFALQIEHANDWPVIFLMIFMGTSFAIWHRIDHYLDGFAHDASHNRKKAGRRP